jgi:hypothetical protein
MCCPSATFAVWSSSWLHGAAAADDVLDALGNWGSAQEFVAGDARSAELFTLPLTDEIPAKPAHMLGSLRANKISAAHLLLPVPGDARGLAGGGPFTAAALDAGEAVLLLDDTRTHRHGMVPRQIATGLFRWTMFTPDAEIVDGYLAFKEAEHELTTVVREGAETLRLLDVARDRPEARLELAAHLRSLPDLTWPTGTPGTALRVLQRTSEISAILTLAAADEPGGAASASSAQLRSNTLRALDNAVREARRAAVNEAVRVIIETR